MFQDAEVLRARGVADPQAPEGTAWLGTPDHLYGIACECALKAVLFAEGIIVREPPQKPFKVHIDCLWKEYLATRSGRVGAQRMIPVVNPFGDWHADHRYCSDDFFDTTRLDGHREGARVGMLALEDAISNGA